MPTPPRPDGPDVHTIHTVYSSTSPSGDPLRGDVKADVVVVGGGIVGMTAAVQLAHRGADVVLVTADEVGAGVTGRSTAKVTALHQLVYADLVGRHGQTAAATYAAATSAAVSWVRDAAGPIWEERAAVTVARNAEEEQQLRREADAAMAAGLPVTVEEELADWPDAVMGLRLDHQGQIDPVALLQHLLASAAGRLRVFPQTRVTRLRERRGSATVTADGGGATGDNVVIATQMPVFDRGGFFALCEPSMSYVVALQHDSGPPSGAGDMMITAGDPTRSVRWARDATTGRQVVLIAGEGHHTGAGQPTTPRYDRLEAWGRERFDGAGPVVTRWSAEDFMSPDRLPFAGPLLRFGGPVHAVTGLSKWGLTLGVASATALVERIDGGQVTDFGRLVDPSRVPDRRALGKIIAVNADVARHMTSGWVRAMASPVRAQPAEGEGSVGRHGGMPRATCRVDGTVHEVSAVCRHLGGIVQWNEGDRTWDCPLHGSRFHADGEVLHGPATRGLATAKEPSEDA